MNIVFSGQSGMEKNRIIKNFIEHLGKKNSTCNKSETQNTIGLYPLESFICKNKVVFANWLSLASEEAQGRLWKEGYHRMMHKLEAEKHHSNFISMHGVFFKRSRFFSPLDWEYLRQLKPDMFITFIDDIYDIWWRLRSRRDDYHPSGMLRMREVLAWRSVEIMAIDTIARNLIPGMEIPHFVIAIKHPIDMLTKLISEPSRMRIYASYPISRTRDHPEKRLEIDKHRSKMHDLFVAFDPLTIDERLLGFTFEKWKKLKPLPTSISIARSDRWPTRSDSFKHALLSDVVEYTDSIEGVDPSEIEEIIVDTEDINKQVVWRDYRLIDQANCVAAYRPSYEGKISGGVNSECSYASFSEKLTVYQFVPKEDGIGGPFDNYGEVCNTYEGFIDSLNRHDATYSRNPDRPSHQSNLY
jgi:adenylate kinase